MERILSFSASQGLLPPARDGLVLCALSGGRDSVALLHFLKERGFLLAAAHFDHHLRPGSGADAAFCRDLCARWRIPFYCGEGDVAALPGNTEANARDARYAFLEKTAEALGAEVIATAHNADDDLETVLLHLTRGCGLNGLTGIRPRRGRIVRPMLAVPRAAVDAYVAEHRLPYVEDATNADPAYSRNRIRHQVLPVLKSINPKVVETASFMTQTLREDLAFLRDHREAVQPAPPPQRCPPLPTVTLPLEGVFETPFWTLVTKIVDPAAQEEIPASNDSKNSPAVLQTSSKAPRPSSFYLQTSPRFTAFTLRSRRPGDYIRPPFRTGKTIKKWFNELSVPIWERDATPVLTDGEENILSVAGIGPNRDFLAHPGQKSIYVQWIKREEKEE